MQQQLKTGDIKRFRLMFQEKQKHKCALCGGRMAPETPCLDHCHTSGMVRAALCGTCNRNEGKVRVAIRYMSKLGHLTRTDPIQWLKNLVIYLDYHERNPSNIIHPSFDLLTGKQKPVKRSPVKRKKKKV